MQKEIFQWYHNFKAKLGTSKYKYKYLINRNVIGLLIAEMATIFGIFTYKKCEYTYYVGLIRFMLAVKRNDLETIKSLVKNEWIDLINIRDSKGNTSLHIAADLNRPNIAKLVSENGLDVEIKNKFSETPLHIATEKGNIAVVKFLYENGANIHAQDNKGNTPLHIAMYQKRINAAEFLLQKGADLSIKDGGGNMPLQIPLCGQGVNLVFQVLSQKLLKQPINTIADNHIIPNLETIQLFEEQIGKISACNNSTDIETLNSTLFHNIFYHLNISLENAIYYINTVEKKLSELSLDKLNDLFKIKSNCMLKLLIFMSRDLQTDPNHIFNWADEEVMQINGLQNLQLELLKAPRKGAFIIERSEENDAISIFDYQSSNDDSNDSELSESSELLGEDNKYIE